MSDGCAGAGPSRSLVHDAYPEGLNGGVAEAVPVHCALRAWGTQESPGFDPEGVEGAAPKASPTSRWKHEHPLGMPLTPPRN